MDTLTPQMVFLVIIPIFIIVLSGIILLVGYYLATQKRNLIPLKLKNELIRTDLQNTKWHWAIGEILQKPLASDQIEALFKKKKIKQNTKMWVEGQSLTNLFQKSSFR